MFCVYQPALTAGNNLINTVVNWVYKLKIQVSFYIDKIGIFYFHPIYVDKQMIFTRYPVTEIIDRVMPIL